MTPSRILCGVMRHLAFPLDRLPEQAVERVLSNSFTRSVARGPLRVTFASGRVRVFGPRAKEETAIRFTDPQAERAVALDPALKLGEMYIEGRLTVEQGSIYDVLSLVNRKGATWSAIALHVLRLASSYGRQRLSLETSQQNVAHHYDLDERLFRLFLDNDMQYSCAYFEHPEQSLEAAQLAKKRHLAAKLLIEPGHKVLDIGSGWGGMALYLAEAASAQVTGITLSEEQLRVASKRAAERGLTDRVRFELRDYRKVTESYDRIVSVGMFEHVGFQNFDTFFTTAARLLKPKGIFVLHSIGRTKPRRAGSPFLEKYIFPGSYMPALSEVLPFAERAGLLIKDVEVLPIHYATTLREWRRRFLLRKEDVLALYDPAFLRMWEFYLAAAEVGFRRDRMFVFQIQLARHQHAVPYTRDYLAERKAALRQAEAKLAAYATIDD